MPAYAIENNRWIPIFYKRRKHDEYRIKKGKLQRGYP
jgi:hypothetical protein